MDQLTIVPAYQPIPLPGPLWILKPLILIGFYLHAIPMNVALVGGLIAGLFLLMGKSNPYAIRLGNTLAVSLPFFVSFAITMGIVPLLFLQVVYGPFFYTSSVLIALPWFLVIIFLLFGYYGFYIYTYKRKLLGRAAPWILIGSSILFLFIAFTFTNNMTLMLRPEVWAALYQKSPYGINLNLDDPQMLPRYLHFVTASFAVTGVTVGSFGLYWQKRQKEYGEWLIKAGATIFLIASLIQLPVGAWFMLSLPKSIMMNYMGQDQLATGIFGTALALVFISLISMFLAGQRGSSKPFIVGSISMFLIIGLMIGIRHLLREYLTRPYMKPESYPIDPQWLPIGLFFVGILALILYLLWLTKVAWQAFHPPALEAKAA